MLQSTLTKIRCPQLKCAQKASDFKLEVLKRIPLQTVNKEKVMDIWSGHVECGHCQARYPILSGVLILVRFVGDFLCSHVKGISKLVDDAEIPSRYRAKYLEAKDEFLAAQDDQALEEDLESDRVTALYLMNHYLRAADSNGWFKCAGGGSPLIESLITEH